MYHRIKNTLAGLAVASAILGLSWTVGQPPTEPGLYAQPAVEAVGVVETAKAARQRARGMRSQATMPFFSFALLPRREG
jgi:hypothetical protein